MASFKTLERRMRQILFRFFSLYPPFLGAGIRIKRIAADLATFEVELALKPWNRNMHGTHFGGSLYSMCDPFFAVIVAEHLGSGYEVWDKAATIRFKKPATGKVRASFHIDPLQLDAIRAQADVEGKALPVFLAKIVDSEGSVVAEVDKTVSVRRKKK